MRLAVVIREAQEITPTYTPSGYSLVPSLSTPQIFIAYSMKNQGGKSGRKRHDDACCNVTEASHTVIFMNVIVRIRHECQRVYKQRAKNTRAAALDL